MKGKTYVITKSDLVAATLTKGGFTLKSHKGDTWTFLNDGKQMLSADDKKETVFTDKVFL